MAATPAKGREAEYWQASPISRRLFFESRAPSTWIRRRAESRAQVLPGRLYLLLGPAGVGKATLVWRYLEPLDVPILHLDGRDERVVHSTRSPRSFVSHVKEALSPRKRSILFLENMHLLYRPGRLLTSLLEETREITLFATAGFWAEESGRPDSRFAGRAIRVEVHPLTQEELRGVPEVVADDVWKRQSVCGSYPGAWTLDSPEDGLREILERTLLDILRVRRVSRPDALEKILALAARGTGRLANLKDWAESSGLGHATAVHYVDILERAFVLDRLFGFTGGRRREVASRPKVFFRDSGIRNLCCGGFTSFDIRTDRRPLLAQWVYGELRKGLRNRERGTLRYWRTANGTEVDFVWKSGNDLQAIAVLDRDLPSERLSRAARSFVEAYEPAALWILNLGYEGEATVNSTRIHWIRPPGLSRLLATRRPPD